MKSMTGYGRGECARDGCKITVEISSVNRKQSEIAVYLPRSLESLESLVRDEVNKRIARGKVTVRVSFHESEIDAPSQVHLNRPLARAYAKEFKKLGEELGVKSEVSLDTILRAPGVLQSTEEYADPQDFWQSIEKALKQSLDALVAMRSREGAHLHDDLSKRLATLQKAIARIEKEAPKSVVRYREQLRDRIAKAELEKPDPDDDRLLKEVVYFADRSDITEELTRFRSHLKQAEQCLKSNEPVGRTLDFITQELNRETNTIGSKANDQLISSEVVKIKSELEKLREQIQNIE